MISILLPIYNFSGRKLVESLHKQGLDLAVPFEIILVDDHSPNPMEENARVDDLDYASYFYLAENKGRSKVRNWLAEQAKYPFLLFIDGDMELEKTDFLEAYVKCLAAKRVICGGHYYQELAPKENLKLHWHYGRNREVRSSKFRNKQPYQSFVPSNFMIEKEVFLDIKFDEGIKGYGHEDTLFGSVLQKEGIEILHLDNGLLHAGLEDEWNFMNKVDVAILNLIKLEKQHGFKETKIQQAAHKFSFLKPLFYLVPTSFLRKLIIKNRNLKILDIYKLTTYYRNK